MRDRTLKKHTREGRFHTAAAQLCFVFAPKDGDEDGGGFAASRQEQEQQQEDAGGLSGFTTKARSSGSGKKRSIPRGAGFGRARRQRR